MLRAFKYEGGERDEKKIVWVMEVCCVVWGAHAVGAPTVSDEKKGDSRWIVAPYAWLAGISGTIGAKGHETSGNASCADLCPNT